MTSRQAVIEADVSCAKIDVENQPRPILSSNKICATMTTYMKILQRFTTTYNYKNNYKTITIRLLSWLGQESSLSSSMSCTLSLVHCFRATCGAIV